MPNDAVQVIGADRLAATLALAARRFGELNRATEQTGRLVESRARGRAPKRSGRLARSITHTTTGDTVAVGSRLVYAPVIHNGWGGHSISPNPFLIPVAAATEPVWREYYAAELNEVISHVKGA